MVPYGTLCQCVMNVLQLERLPSAPLKFLEVVALSALKIHSHFGLFFQRYLQRDGVLGVKESDSS